MEIREVMGETGAFASSLNPQPLQRQDQTLRVSRFDRNGFSPNASLRRHHWAAGGERPRSARGRSSTSAGCTTANTPSSGCSPARRVRTPSQNPSPSSSLPSNTDFEIPPPRGFSHFVGALAPHRRAGKENRLARRPSFRLREMPREPLRPPGKSEATSSCGVTSRSAWASAASSASTIQAGARSRPASPAPGASRRRRRDACSSRRGRRAISTSNVRPPRCPSRQR